MGKKTFYFLLKKEEKKEKKGHFLEVEALNDHKSQKHILSVNNENRTRICSHFLDIHRTKSQTQSIEKIRTRYVRFLLRFYSPNTETIAS